MDPADGAAPPRRRIVAVTIAVVLAVQLVVPTIVMLSQERPAFLGWHMFATTPMRTTAVATFPDGQRDVDLSRHVVRMRPEVDYTAWLPDHLCQQLEDALTVTVRRGDDEVEQRCRP